MFCMWALRLLPEPRIGWYPTAHESSMPDSGGAGIGDSDEQRLHRRNCRLTVEYPTLYRVERDVIVDVARLFPASGVRRDELPLWVKSCGLRLEPSMPARQLAWIRRADGGWLAIVVMPASSANGRSTLTIQLWLSPDGLTTDLTI
jgi:hypothetical protein